MASHGLQKTDTKIAVPGAPCDLLSLYGLMLGSHSEGYFSRDQQIVEHSME